MATGDVDRRSTSMDPASGVRKAFIDLEGQKAFSEATIQQAQAGLERAKIESRSRTIDARAALLSAKSGAVRTGMTVYDWGKPIIFTALFWLFVLGPGTAALNQIIVAMNPIYWFIGIITVLLIWRNI